MSGTVCGIIDQRIYAEADDAKANQVAFKNLYEFFQRMVAVGNAERVALQYGLSGTGTDYYDGANPFGENAFAVFKLLASASTERTIDLYILIQWADTSVFGASPGNPGLMKNTSSTDGTGIAMAYRDDGTSPWAGTTNNDGTDTKGATVWTNGGSTVRVLDRCCASGGSCYTNKENLLPLEDCVNDYTRVHIIGDADSVVIITDTGDVGVYKHKYLGIYEPRGGLNPVVPAIHICDLNVIPFSNLATTYGSSNCGTYYEGGVTTNISADGIRGFRTTYFDKLFSISYQPNDQIVPVEFDEFSMFVVAEEVHKGLLGQLPVGLYGIACTQPTNTTNPAATRAYFGLGAQSAVKLSVPWDGGDQPGTGTLRQGRTF